MIDAVQGDLQGWIEAGLGWAVLAAARPNRSEVAIAAPITPPTARAAAPMRLRATITIDIDACDANEAEAQTNAIRGQFELLKHTHPKAELTFQRRKPRSGRRAPPPGLVVAPYIDD